MFTLEEISAWSNEELVTAIRVLLPEGTSLEESTGPGYFVVKLVNAEGIATLEEPNTDHRLALLNVFGSLLSSSSVSETSPWKRKRELPRGPITFSPSVPDPEDLDPNEISNLYQKK